MLQRDPQDRRYPERLTGSYLASLVLHVLAAALFFTVAVSSSQEGATQSVSGGEVVTVERQAPVVAQVQPAAPSPAAPVPVAPRIAPVHHTVATQPALQKQPPRKRELSHIVKNAPPLPKPIPQATQAPAPQPTQPVFEPKPENDIAAVPVSVSTLAPITIATKVPPTAAPSPVPSIAATPQPSPRPVPTTAPTTRPATPAPPAPTVAPTATAVAVVVKATAAPTASAAPASKATAAPAPKAGVPSPSPTQGAPIAAAKGLAPSPGPVGHSSPGPRAGNSGQSKAGPSRPITVRPTPKPPAVARPSSGGGNSLQSKMQNFLQSLAGTPVVPTSKTYNTAPSIKGHIDPTPPPEVLAITKYIYETGHGLLTAERVKMWVTDVRGSMCYGWEVRYPTPLRDDNSFMAGPNSGPARNGVQIGGGSGALSQIESGQAPIVEGITSVPCSKRGLTPFTPPTNQ